MTPKEKAKELVGKFKQFAYANARLSDSGFEIQLTENAKQCAIICVGEIINSAPLEPTNVDWDDCGATHQYWYEQRREDALIFWQQVKTEIE